VNCYLQGQRAHGLVLCLAWWGRVWEDGGGSPVVAVVGEWPSLATAVGRADPVLPCWHESEL